MSNYEFAIHIPQRHLDEGVAGDCWWCPVARGFDEYFGPEFKSEVEHDLVTILRRIGTTVPLFRLIPTDDAYEFTHNYDEQSRVENGHVVFPPPQTVHYTLV